jgi:hypothetical protein
MAALGNRTEEPGCLVEQAVNAALNQSFQRAEELLLASFENVTLAMLSADVRGRLAARAEARAGSCAGNPGPCISPGQPQALLGGR